MLGTHGHSEAGHGAHDWANAHTPTHTHPHLEQQLFKDLGTQEYTHSPLSLSLSHTHTHTHTRDAITCTLSSSSSKAWDTATLALALVSTNRHLPRLRLCGGHGGGGGGCGVACAYVRACVWGEGVARARAHTQVHTVGSNACECDHVQQARPA